jgi:CubicO group peptidase (beta-lactamase class C family)
VPDPASGVDDAAAGSLAARALRGPSEAFRLDGRWNRRELHAAELPSSNGIGDARSLARLYAAVLGGVDGGPPLLAPATVRRARRVEAEGLDAVLGVPARIGTGFELGDALGPGVGADAFGHTGAGGSVAWADPAAGVSFGYVCNRMHTRPGPDPRAAGLARAVYAVLETGACRDLPESAQTME